MPQANAHSLTTRQKRRLLAALLGSLALHLLPFVRDFDFGQNFRSTVPPPLQATLMPPPMETPPLTLPEPPKTAESKPPPKRDMPRPAPAKAPKTWTQTVRDHLKQLDRTGQFYPAEAIARGLEGDADVLLVLGEDGRVTATRLERSSGHPLLDEAALRAVRSLQSLPMDAPRQVVLPVRFRLRNN